MTPARSSHVTDAADLARFATMRATGDTRLRDELVLEHRWIAERCASRFAGRGEPYDDLLQVALLSLVKTVDRFDPEHGSTFPRYAIPSVTGELRRHFRDHTWRMSVSRRAKDLGSNLNAAIDVLHQELGRSPTPREVATYLGQPLDHIIEALAARNAYRPRSLSATVDNDDGRSIEDALGDDDDALSETPDRIAVRTAAATLDERRQKIVLWRFYEGLTQSEIGERLGIGQVQVSRLLRSALADLREVLEAVPGGDEPA
jgi:RNA polymerase sigma-B factor